MTFFALALLLTACESLGLSSLGGSGARGDSGAGIDMSKLNDLQRDFIVNVGDRVFFAYDSSAINEEGHDILKAQAAWLKTNGKTTVTVEGHADKRGTREYNLALGERRANAVKQQLSALGVASKRMKTVSYGKERPVDAGDDENAYQRNRRGVTLING